MLDNEILINFFHVNLLMEWIQIPGLKILKSPEDNLFFENNE